jgi:putative sterol carrier protein
MRHTGGRTGTWPHRLTRLESGCYAAIQEHWRNRGTLPNVSTWLCRRMMMAVTSAKEIFETQLPGRLKDHPDLIQKINASYKFIVNGDEGGSWLVDLTKEGGVVCESEADAACTITIKDQDLVNMVNGDLNPQMAFMTGKLKIKGDMGLAMKLQALFG